MSADVFRPRSVLFVPATRLELLPKALRTGPDAVVVDLEDAVPPELKERARTSVVQRVESHVATPVLVRINPARSAWFEDDLQAVVDSGAAGAVLPKAESADSIAVVRAALGTRLMVLGIESAAGLAAARVLCRREVDAVYFGAEDYVADLGGRRTSAGLEVLVARSEVALAARLGGIPAIDQAVLAVRDDDAFRRDGSAGADLGFAGKICLHPRQVHLAHEVFSPTPDELAWARAVLASRDAGPTLVHDHMVDEVHVRMAQALVARGQR